MNVTKAEKKLSIAIVYGRGLLPMNFADQKTVAHFVEFLHQRGHSVDLYCTNEASVDTQETQNWYSSRLNMLFMENQSPLWKFLNILKFFLLLKPIQVGYFWNFNLKKRLDKKLENYDAVYTYYLRSAEVTKHVAEKNKPISILALQLSQTLNTKRIYQNATNIFDKMLYFFESRLMERYEATIWQSFDKTVLIGNKDVVAISEACKKYRQPLISNVYKCAHGVDIHKFFRPEIKSSENMILYCGVMRTPTNIQACLWFYKNVWPTLKAKRPNLEWFIVGRDPAKEIIELGEKDGIKVTGTVKDPSEYISKASVCINPMQAAGGMQNKLIEYMASKRPVVATSIANEGIGATPEKHLIIANTNDEFVTEILKLLTNQSERERLSDQAFEFVKSEWSWESHFLHLEKLFYK
jgi:glycosyltransferase involved in cell wall biosynthesis